MPADNQTQIWTIGHSTRNIEDFLALLSLNGIEILADVRRFPSSRKYPQFTREQLSESLIEKRIGYLPFIELGGRRRARSDSRNTAWRNTSFRGYADYMEQVEFRAGMARLLETAGEKR